MRVVEIFDSLQGEGVWAGVPMTFVRLAGCNAPELGLGCLEWCDTRDAWGPGAGSERSIDSVAAEVRFPRCCVTGGEPLLQEEEVSLLVAALHLRGVLVHLETNGTLVPRFSPLADWITVSPKPPVYDVTPELGRVAAEVKVIVDARLACLGLEEASERVREIVRPFADAQVCLQPEASGGLELVRMTADLVMAHPKWRLSLQLHKIVGIR